MLEDLFDDPYVAHFLGSPSTLATFAVLVLLGGVVALSVRRRRILVLATGVAAAAVGALTLAPARGWTTLAVTADPVTAVATALHPRACDLWAWTSADGPANVALYVPLALCLGLLLRRPVLAGALCVATSLVIESYQAATGTRVGAFADVVSNGLGAALGTVVAATLVLVVHAGRAATTDRRVAV